MKLRPYQEEAVAAVYEHLRTREDNPCVVLPTGSGKTPAIAQICSDAVNLWNGRVLVVAHVKELLEQAVDKLRIMAPRLPVGVYSAGLRSRDLGYAVTVAGIQSIYKKAAKLGRFDLVLVDEAHLIPTSGDGMYLQLLKDLRVINPALRVVGFTATPYRTKGGMICSEDAILNHTCYECGVRELIAQGYLCQVRTKAGKRKVDLSNVHVRGGEYIARELEDAMDDDLVRSVAVDEMLEQTKIRRSVLIFAAGIDHAQHIQRDLQSQGVECGFVSGETLPFERADTLRRFQDGTLKYLVNVNVLTTGFDAPNIDCVAMLRPTMSPGLYYQMVGRGFRLHPSKTDCLVLDFGGNVLRHGPVDAIQVAHGGGSGSGEAPAKECPECQAVINPAYSTCPECGHDFPKPEEKPKHDPHATNAGIITGQVEVTEYSVSEVAYDVHEKRNAPADHPRTMKVEYRVGFTEWISEWVCIEHPAGSFPRRKAEAWWRERSDDPCPTTADDAVDLALNGSLAEPSAITVERVAGNKWPKISEYELGAVPEAVGDMEREPEMLPHGFESIDPDDIPF